jgi:hypothetical protein|tara:strand:- start:271 stop:417 length:147 start_codon:yes stop_codon:yes gene_type:complete
MLPETQTVYREQRALNELVRAIRNYQAEIEYSDENRFLKSKAEHDRWQ